MYQTGLHLEPSRAAQGGGAGRFTHTPGTYKTSRASKPVTETALSALEGVPVF